jgi:hypothetical protein
MTVAPTTLDVARAIDALDVNAFPETGAFELRQRVASNLAYQFHKHNGWGGRKNVTTRDVRAALIAHGASTFTVEQHARAIAAMIRADFSDGRTR